MSELFSLHEVGPGAWSAVAPGTASPAVGNAAIVDLGDKTLVVDTFMTSVAARHLAGEARRLTGRDPALVVNTHWHSDHVRGNPVFAASLIVGTRRMNELIVADTPSDDAHAARIAGMRSTADEIASSGDHAAADGTRALADALEAETGYRPALPDLLIEDRLVIEGERSAVVIGLGRGHTESDLFVHLPDVGAVIAGDLLWTGMHPKTDDGFPTDWAVVLEQIAGLGATTVAAGHGTPGTSADVTAMAAYMRALAGMVDAVMAGDLDADHADPPPGTDDWQGVGRFRRGLSRLAAGRR